MAERLEKIVRSNQHWITVILFGGAFADASVLPFPIATLFVLSVLFYPERTRAVIIASAAGTITGGIAGYFAGRLAWVGPDGDYSGLARLIFSNSDGFNDLSFQRVSDYFGKRYKLILFAGAFTPVPYGVFSVSSGIFEMEFAAFVIITTVSHLTKYVLFSLVTLKLGQGIFKFIRVPQNTGLVVLIIIILITALTMLII